MNKFPKYRVWDETVGKMLFFKGIFDNKRPTTRTSTSPTHMANMLNKIHIMPYTDMRDKKGREIYEHDIIRYDIENDHGGAFSTYRSVTEEVVYKNAQFTPLGAFYATHWSDYSHDLNSIEVIGNKFENPDLVEEFI